MAWARLSKLISFFRRELLLGSFVGRSNCKELASVSKNEVKRMVKWQDASLKLLCPCARVYLGVVVMSITGHIYTTTEYGAKLLQLAMRLPKYPYHG